MLVQPLRNEHVLKMTRFWEWRDQRADVVVVVATTATTATLLRFTATLRLTPKQRPDANCSLIPIYMYVYIPKRTLTTNQQRTNQRFWGSRCDSSPPSLSATPSLALHYGHYLYTWYFQFCLLFFLSSGEEDNRWARPIFIRYYEPVIIIFSLSLMV